MTTAVTDFSKDQENEKMKQQCSAVWKNDSIMSLGCHCGTVDA